MSLGSQHEAETIYAYEIGRIEFAEEARNNKWSFREMVRHDRAVSEFEKGWSSYEPGPLELHYPIGPVRKEPVIPAGWEFKGEGSRRAYLSPSGVIYKIEAGDWKDNEKEHIASQRVRALPQIIGVIIPATSLYRVEESDVIAMEYMDGLRNAEDWEYCCSTDCHCAARAGYCAGTLKRKIREEFRIGDLHSHNVLWVPAQRKWAVVDLGICV